MGRDVTSTWLHEGRVNGLPAFRLVKEFRETFREGTRANWYRTSTPWMVGFPDWWPDWPRTRCDADGCLFHVEHAWAHGRIQLCRKHHYQTKAAYMGEDDYLDFGGADL